MDLKQVYFIEDQFFLKEPLREVVIFGPAWDRAYLIPFLTKSFFCLKMQFHNFLLYKKAQVNFFVLTYIVSS